MTSAEMDSCGIIFELQWKKRQGTTARDEDFASLGIWDTPDSSLDWSTFKSYLSQNLGTSEDISVAYIDSEGDELPIDSECEFQEALKFARKRARKGHKIVLKVDKQGDQTAPVVDFGERKRLWKQPKYYTKSGRGTKNKDDSERVDDTYKSFRHALTSELDDLLKHNKFLVEKLEIVSKMEEQQKKSKPDKIDDTPPAWFKKYMQKMKNEIVMEVTANTKEMLANMGTPATSIPSEKTRRDFFASRTRKRNSDEDSSDTALGSDKRDHRLLRKIEKLHQQEKKIERKLDSKLEKLENKTKRMMEKKSQSKPRPEWERLPERKIPRKRSSDVPVGTYLMDAVLLNDGPKAETHIKLGKRFTKIWEIMNTGTLPWTDKTELRLAWGTLGLEPEEPFVKCPILEPGEKGQIAVNFRAPDFPGTFESYWHFYHMGERFGHWIGCAVVVEEPNKCGKYGFSVGENSELVHKYSNGVAKKLSFSTGKEGLGNFEKLDNVEAPINEKPSSSDAQDYEASINQNLNNIEVESNMHKSDAALDLSIKSVPEHVVNVASNHPNNNNINEAPATLQTSESAGKQAKERDPEYLSDSDDDNLSIISATGLSSESEEEKFVIVPMPACFMRDVPLGSESVPVVVKHNSHKHTVQLDSLSNCSTLELPTEEATKLDSVAAEIDGEDRSSVTSHEAGDRWWDSEDFKSSVYAVDANGSCVPLESAWPANGTTKIPLGYAAKPCGSPKHHQPDAGNPQPDTASSSDAKSDKSSTKTARAFSQIKHTFTQSFNTSSSSGKTSDMPPPKTSGYCFTTTHTNSFGSTPPPSPNTSTSASPQATSMQSGPNDNAVHILPETIVNGAINVASSAYSTARAVISNLRASGPPTKSVPRDVASGEMTTTECLKLLSNMGFGNSNLNVLLLQRYDNDVAKVVAELLRGNNQASV